VTKEVKEKKKQYFKEDFQFRAPPGGGSQVDLLLEDLSRHLSYKQMDQMKASDNYN